MKQILENKALTAFVLVLFGVCYGAYELYEFQDKIRTAQNRSLSALKQEIIKIRTDADRARDFANNIDTVKQSFREQSLQLESVLESIPRDFEVTKLLQTCNDLAKNSSVQLVKFKPGPEAKSEVAGSALNLSQISFDLSIRGKFFSVMTFLDQLSKMKRMVSFDKIEMRSSSESRGFNKKQASRDLDVSVVMSAFSVGGG